MERCPTRDQLKRLLLGELEDGAESELEAHVEACELCQAAMAELADDDETRAWRDALLGPGDEKADRDLPEFRSAALIRNLGSSPCGEPTPDPAMTGSRSIRFPGPPTELGPLGQLGPYHIKAELGSGATGVVFLAHDEPLNCLVAMKVLRPELAADPNARTRFVREARTAVSVRHENVVVVHHVGSSAEFPLPYLVMEYIDGESLADRIRREGVLPPRAAATIGQQLAAGLARAHEGGLVHRDVKPSNVLLQGTTGRAKLSDFGIARAVAGSDDSENGRFTRTGQIVGSPAYMSPEQVLSPESVDARSDVYSLGVVLYQMLTGEPPFRGETQAVLRQVVDHEPVPPRVLNNNVPRDLETIVLKCLEKEPRRRYQTATEVAADLSRWLDGEPIEAQPTSWVTRWGKWVKRRPALSAALLACGLAFVALAVVFVAYDFRLRNAYRETVASRDAARKSAAIAEERRQFAERAKRTAEQKDEENRGHLRLLGLDAAVRLGAHSPDKAAAALERVPSELRGWEWHRLALELSLAPRPREVIGTHDWGVADVLLSADGGIVVSSGLDGRVIRWDGPGRSSQELEKGVWLADQRRWARAVPFPGESAAGDCFSRLCWLDDGRSIAGVSIAGKVVVWRARGGPERRVVHTHGRPLFALAASADGRQLLAGDDQGVLVRVDLLQGHASSRVLLARRPIFDVCRLGGVGWVIGQEDGTVSIVDAGLTRVLDHLKVSGPVWGLDVRRDEGLIAVACEMAAVATFSIARDSSSLRRAETFVLTDERDGMPRAIHAVRFSPDGNRIVAADDRGRIAAWNVADRLPLFVSQDQHGSSFGPDDIDRIPRPFRRRVSALRFTPDGGQLVTGGRDTSIKRWHLVLSKGTTELRVGERPHARFDPKNARLLWVGAADGTLSLWDSRTGKKVVGLPAHAGAITGMDLAPASGLVATCGSDRIVRFWRRSDERIEPAGNPIMHQRVLRSVALSPDGKQVAAYDNEEKVSLWEVSTGRLVGRQELKDEKEGSAVGGVVAFNADGSRLGAAGPGQSFWVFSGLNLDVLDTPYLYAGNGGTALLWHSDDVGQAIGGDTMGRVHGTPHREERPATGFGMPSMVVGLSWVPDGSRLAAASTDGSVSISDPHRDGKLFTVQSDHPAPTSLHFDRTGRRLALVHAGGEITIWETGDLVSRTVADRRADWRESVLLQGREANLIHLRAESFALDASDRLHLLYAKKSRDEATPDRWGVFHGESTIDGFREERVEDFGTISEPEIDSVSRSLAVAVEGNDLWATVRRCTRGTAGQLYLLRRTLTQGETTPAPFTSEALFEPANTGFYVHLFTSPNERPSLLYFSHDDHHLERLRWQNGRWTPTILGRQGDGLAHWATVGPDRRIHVVFTPKRFGGDPSPLVYLREGETPLREVVDPSPASGQSQPGADPCVTVGSDGSPVVLYTRRGPNGRSELIVAHRTESGWTRERALDPSPADVSNIQSDREGRLRLAFADDGGRRVLLATRPRTGSTWLIELLWEDPRVKDAFTENSRLYQLAILLDSRERPVVIVARRSADNGWLRVFRPKEARVP